MSVFQTKDGTDLNAVDTGGNGIPLIFQHGLGGDERQTAEVFPLGPTYRRLTLECRGHGQSQAGTATAFSIAQFSDDLAAFIESKFSRPVLIGGISLGAAITLRLAVKRPDLVRGIVAARPAWLFDRSPANMLPNAYVGHLLLHADRAAALQKFNRSAIAEEIANTSPDNLSSLRGFFDRANSSVLAALLTRISSDGPQVDEAELKKLNAVALVIGTDRDYVHPYRYAEALAECIPNATLVKITPKSVSHEAYMNQFRAALTTFLDRFGF